MKVTLTEEEIRRCKEFSERSALSQQTIEFGQHDTAARSAREVGRDNLIGKLAEVAFAKEMKSRYNIDIELDFEYYPRGEWDGQDAVLNGWKIDVKATKRRGKWMLIEWSKINFRQREKDLPDLFVMASVGWNMATDQPDGTVDLIGCASLLYKMRAGVPTTRILRKGEELPDTSSHIRLQADNFGIKFEDLQQDWDISANYMLTHKPKPLDDYPNPYTGETYRTLFPEDYR